MSRLRVGFVGSGFVAHFHAQAFASVRHADITAIMTTNPAKGSELAAFCRSLGVGNPKVYPVPYLADEAHAFGYIAESRYYTECFLAGQTPFCTLKYGARITELLMAADLSAERGATVPLPCPELETFVPAVARGEWRG